ncbi:Hypothetical protein R9X50_00535500 [Acrodontium crateriforme]|uniref:Uncharacterized protein n=1 Tax=Acrodontium crateriforme TaxID=150365 RepID=A0AAQ3RBF9_9PEZI|nr:Hypothetical protein R9X50_00535500 [Acrodontium crateriforme]
MPGAPATTTVRSMGGTYMLNRDISDSMEALMKMQGVGWMVRQAVKYSNVTTVITQSTSETGHVKLHSVMQSTGGVKNEETWVLDGVEREKENWIWGKVKGNVKYIKISELEDEFLKEGWAQDCIDANGGEGELIASEQFSLSDTWTAYQVIGFADVNGERRQVRKVVGKKGDQVERVRMIHDWREE